ncbi:hypothetical protein R1flu_020531 [Riccia fluitans]|uniref:Uncharacterized protein n=1 Tax=Riccia fluitans TaxID=41844 RepID=A0ABD1ZLR9_9MARC
MRYANSEQPITLSRSATWARGDCRARSITLHGGRLRTSRLAAGAQQALIEFSPLVTIIRGQAADPQRSIFVQGGGAHMAYRACCGAKGGAPEFTTLSGGTFGDSATGPTLQSAHTLGRFQSAEVRAKFSEGDCVSSNRIRVQATESSFVPFSPEFNSAMAGSSGLLQW